ncbi:homoserine kinase [Pseudobacillus badius]|uniref:homoserine kinase n=1 Tax=Bacillus badius TaxID=1455 RepID=UPI0007B0A004|nr:homoserine kinase [Bacillus badius]KZN99571.1 homoserine kinase [Bacillus badius]MED0665909.1 homoserine kinase [Bacillus badius]OCS85675.1 homoserine kinase [Bacillus badius]OVE51971.1 homoserine kinase [Bacillus badius]TDW03407.1 homoserine kinase [Bacillus badius]
MSAPVTMKVPASTANLGPGFDSLGLALNLYLTLEITPAAEWHFEHRSPMLEGLPNDKSHLVYQAAEKTAAAYGGTLPPLHIIMASDIPLARGLGSSAAAIAAGIELADRYADLQLSDEDKLKIGNQMEGHPDNIGAALFGGMVAGVSFGEEAEIVQLPVPAVEAVVLIPPYEVKTSDARSVLPESFTRQQAVEASAVANVLLAALSAGNYELAGKLMEKDQFHEPYRLKLIKELEEARSIAKTAGAYATVISGAGPTILTFAPKGKGADVMCLFRDRFTDCDVKQLDFHIGKVQCQ